MALSLSGRAPWYDKSGNVKDPVIIGIAGASCSGKTDFSLEIQKSLKSNWIVCVFESSFYHSPPDGVDLKEYNWDHPFAFDYDCFFETISQLKEGKKVELKGNQKLPPEKRKKETIYGADVVLVCGTLVLFDSRIRDLLDLKVFIDADEDICLVRRIRRDCFRKGLNYLDVIEVYQKFVKPGFDSYILPTKRYANVIVPSRAGQVDSVSVSLLTQFISNKLAERYRWELAMDTDGNWGQPPQNLHMIHQTSQIVAMMTILRNENTSLEDFIFHTDRLTRLLVEETLSAISKEREKLFFLQREKEKREGLVGKKEREGERGEGERRKGEETQVLTPTNAVYEGIELNYSGLCAVSVMRAGEALENAVREVIKDIKIGKMLIQSVNKAPRLFYCSLNHVFSAHGEVLLLDAALATGSTVKMAVRVLLDHGVKEENIFFLTLIASRQGLHSVLKLYPKMHIFTTAVDEELDENFYIKPGIGNFGDRYFGTR